MNQTASTHNSHDPHTDLWQGVEWAWFDLDDTLYDFKESSMIALREVYRSMSLDRFFDSEQSWIDIYHRHNASLWAEYNVGAVTKEFLKMERFRRPLMEAGADAPTAAQLSKDLDPEYLRQLAATGLTIPGTHRLLESLRSAGVKIGILSNGFTEVQHDKIETARLTDLIDCIVLSDEIGINKPDRRLFDYALKKSGAKASNSLMIGDNPDTDIAGALNSGWRAYLFNPQSDSLLNLLP